MARDKNTKHLIIGAGITGLLHAWYAIKRGEEVTILEQSKQPGGLIQTKSTKYGLVETAANGILNNKLFEDICSELKLKIIPANKAAKKRFIYHKYTLRRLPLDLWGKLRLFRGIATKQAKVLPHETLADWGERILGRGTADALLQPAFGGIYAGDVQKMSAELVLKNRILGTGSMLKQMRLVKKLKPHLIPRMKGMVSLRNGMGSFVQSLRAYIQSHAELILDFKVESLNQIYEKFSPDKITIACGARTSLKLLESKLPDIKSLSNQLKTFNLVTVTRFTQKPLIKNQAFGILFPPKNNIRARGVLFNNHIFNNRAKPDCFSETWIYGGAFDQDITNKTDKTIFDIVANDCAHFQSSAKPVFQMCHKSPNALPAYDTTLLNINTWLDEHLPPNIKVEGNFRNGIGLSAIIERAADIPLVKGK